MTATRRHRSVSTPRPRARFRERTASHHREHRAGTRRETQPFFPNNHKFFDSEGREYVGDATAAAWVNALGWTADLNPGSAVNVKVPFDVPPGLRPESIELHDSAFSQGMSVKLN